MSLCAERADGLEASFRNILPRPEPIAVAYVLTEGERGQEYRQRLLICSVRAFTQAQRRQLFQVMGSHSSGDSLLCSVLCCPKNIPLAHDMLRLLSAQKLLKLHLLTRSTWKKMGLRQVLFHSLRGRASVNLEADRNSQFTNCDQLVQVHIASFLNDRDLCAYRATCRSFYLNTRDYRRPADGLLGEAIAGMGPALPQVNLDLVKHLFSPTLRNDRGGYFRLAIATLPDEYLRRLPELLDWVPGELTDAVDCKHKWKDLANFNGIGLRLPISLMIRQCRQTNEQWELLGWLLSLQVYQAPAIDGLISAFVDADSLQRFDQVLERAEQPEMAARAHACLLKAKSGLFAAEGIE